MTSPKTPTSPREAYNQARAAEMAQHQYTTEGIHAVCSCGNVGTTESIAQHIEDLAEAAGVGARENAIRKAVAEHEQLERLKKAEAEERMAKAKAAIEKEDRESFR